MLEQLDYLDHIFLTSLWITSIIGLFIIAYAIGKLLDIFINFWSSDE